MKDMPGLAVKDTPEMLWLAYHEAGHTVRAASWALPISRVSIEPSPNGRAIMFHLMFFSRHKAGLTIWKEVKKVGPDKQRLLDLTYPDEV